MGRPKLTLPGPDGRPVISIVVDALHSGGVDRVVVVGPPADQPGATALGTAVEAAGAMVVLVPQLTTDMRSTVEVGLEILKRVAPDYDGLVITPGDSIGLSGSLVGAVVCHYRADPSRMVVPIYGNRRGHPIALPPDLARSIPRLPEGLGINALRERHPDRLELLPLDEPGTAQDLDTPEEYRTWTSKSGGGEFDNLMGR